jgi:hypothetical protein
MSSRGTTFPSTVKSPRVIYGQAESGVSSGEGYQTAESQGEQPERKEEVPTELIGKRSPPVKEQSMAETKRTKLV